MLGNFKASEIANKFEIFFTTVGNDYAKKIGPSKTSPSEYLNKIPLESQSLYLYPTNIYEIN